MFQSASSAHLIEELLCPTEDVFKLRQFQEVLLQCFLVGVYLFQFVLQLFKSGLPDKVNSWFGRRKACESVLEYSYLKPQNNITSTSVSFFNLCQLTEFESEIFHNIFRRGDVVLNLFLNQGAT